MKHFQYFEQTNEIMSEATEVGLTDEIFNHLDLDKNLESKL